MRASKLIQPQFGDEMVVVQAYYANIARCLAAQERAIEALAKATAHETWPEPVVRRIRRILDGEE